MQPISITAGINTIMDFCNEFRSKETAGYYAGACEFILTVYQQLNQETYDAGLNTQICRDIQKELFSSGYNSYRYIFRVLGMLDDYYSGHPFRNKYMLNNRYKHQLNSIYQQWADELKSSLTVKSTTIPVMYSIIRDFFYYLQQNGITELDCVQHEFLYTFLMHEYTDHHASMGNVMYVLRHICTYLRKKGLNNFPTELLPFSLPLSRRKVLPAFEQTDMENILSTPDKKPHPVKETTRFLC
ncbi:MAG: hypothetical protein P4L49_10440 [Desulfosporosinus sp.]|nr:hypothetical protein [Desulfosporosinus sp.]